MIKPADKSVCIECKEPIGDEPYRYTKMRGHPPVFIHNRCYEKLLPKNKRSKPNG